MMTKAFHFACIVLLLLAGSGCTLQSGPQVYLSAATADKSLCKIAVLPFTNETEQKTAAVQVYRIFISELIASGIYRVEPEGEVYFFMNRNRLRLGDILDSQTYAELAQQLEVDAVVRGRVIELEDKRGRSGSVPHCALQIDLVSAENGALLASVYHRRSGDDYQKILHFGTIRTVSGLVAQVSREVITAWQEKGLSHCPE
ncbi:MAG: hypothetical protein KAT93_07040 [Desulfuromonadales bacterium]|nr:hypothetical protein [Desulfuromonadales bacterium]